MFDANPDVVKRAQVGESARERIPKGGASDCADEINAADLRGRSDTRAAAGCAPSGLPSQQKTSIDHPRWMKLVRARRFSRRAPVQHIRRPISRVLYRPRSERGRDGHSSGTPVTRRIKQPTRMTGPDRPKPSLRVIPTRSCSRWGLPCRFHRWKRGALLPHRFTLTAANAPRRSVLCGTVPKALRPRRTLSGTVCPWSPDFPPRPPFGIGPGRPSGRLTRLGMALPVPSVKCP